MNAQQNLIAQFINLNANLEVPFFQRSYVWEKDQWERLLTDMEFVSSSQRPYFLGAIILKEKRNSHGQIVGHTIIDGQQRLTTLTIFFKVLCLATNQMMWFDNTFRKLNQTRDCVIRQSQSCAADFDKVVKLESLESIPEGKTSSNVIRAYNYFRKAIVDIIYGKDNKDEDGNQILNVNLLPLLLTFVVICLGDTEDEQQIFDTINSLGVRLSTGELLKNYLFNNDQVDLYNTIWKPAFEANQEDIDYWNGGITTGRLSKKNIEMFLYYFLQIKCQEKGIVGDKKSFRRWENLFSSYKTLVEDNHISKKDLAIEIAAYAHIFKNTFSTAAADDELSSEFGLNRLNFITYKLDKSTVIPYLMYIVKNVPDEDEKLKIFTYLETYLMRRIISNASNKNYSDFFTENLIGQGIKTYEALKKYVDDKDETTSLAMPSDAKVLFGMKDTEFKNNKTALAILYLLESRMRTTKHSTKLLTFDGYSLEHMMPKKWKKTWPTMTEGFEPEEREKLICTLGNMAMITKGLNSSISNSAWDNKRKNLESFSSGIETMADFLKLDEWNENEITNRAEWLALQANNIWKL